MTTGKNAAAREWIAQQYGVPIITVADLCEVSRPRAYAMARQWLRDGLVEVARMPSAGPEGSWSNTQWVWLTREMAWAYLGFDPGPWVPRVSTVSHVRALAELRLRLTGAVLDPAVWTSERLLRHRGEDSRGFGQRFGHVHDAEFRDGAGARWAVEVELTRKKGAGRTTATLRAALEAARERGLAGVVYFTRGAGVRRGLDLAVRSLEQAGEQELVSMLDIRDLDEVLTTTTVSDGEVG